jgi:acetyl-CoA C-acetyltransferase
MAQDIYIVQAKRTAIGSFLGSLSTISAADLGALVIKEILSTTGLQPDLVSQVIMGQILTGGAGQNPARQASIRAAIPITVPAFTINKVCGSGLQAVMLAASSIKAGDSEIIIAGGQENMSLAMHASYLRTVHKFGDKKMVDLMMQDGLTDAFSNVAMGITAENIAKKFDITREAQDQFAFKSQQKAKLALENDRFKDEIVAVSVKDTLFATDESVRLDASLEKMQKLKPAFLEDGSVTAANSSTINDGAAALLIVSADIAKRYNLEPLARIVSYASCGVDPSIMGTGPVPASKLALEKAGWGGHELDLIEANEAFAAQAIYVNQEMGWDADKVNVNGGAIALGHPIGASGARILVTLIHEMRKKAAKRGLATLCIGGGMGVAMCIEC